MKQLKMFLMLLLTSVIFFGFSKVNASELELSFDNYSVLDYFQQQFPDFKDSDYVQNLSKQVVEKYSNNYENVLVKFYMIQVGQYVSHVFSYNGSNYNVGFQIWSWNDNKPFYYVKTNQSVYLVKDNVANSTRYSNSDFNISYLGFNSSSFDINSMISYSNTTLFDSLFACDSISNNLCNIRTYQNYTSSWNYSLPYVYYKFNTQDDFILPALNSSNFKTTNTFTLKNGTKIGNVNPIGFQDLMEDNYYNFHKVDIQENKCDKTFVLGAVSNVNEINLNVKGKTSALSEPLQGTFTLNYTNDSLLTDKNFNIEFSSTPELAGSYNFKCSTTDKFCYLNYKYNSQDDIEENVKFSFKITFNNNNSNIFPFTKIYSCTTDKNYTNISYTYSNSSSDTTTSNPSLDNILTDESSPDLDILGDTSTWLPPGPVDSLIMLPLNFINTIINKLSGTCSPVNLPIPFMQNKYIVLPCLNTIFENIEGFSTLFNLIGVIGSVYLLYNYFVRFYKWVDDTLTLRENTWQDWGGD